MWMVLQQKPARTAFVPLLAIQFSVTCKGIRIAIRSRWNAFLLCTVQKLGCEMGAECRSLGHTECIRLKIKIPGVPSRVAGYRIQVPGTYGMHQTKKKFLVY